MLLCPNGQLQKQFGKADNRQSELTIIIYLLYFWALHTEPSVSENQHYIAVQTLGTFFWGKVINQSVYQGKLYAPVTKRGAFTKA